MASVVRSVLMGKTWLTKERAPLENTTNTSLEIRKSLDCSRKKGGKSWTWFESCHRRHFYSANSHWMLNELSSTFPKSLSDFLGFTYSQGHKRYQISFFSKSLLGHICPFFDTHLLNFGPNRVCAFLIDFHTDLVTMKAIKVTWKLFFCLWSALERWFFQ